MISMRFYIFGVLLVLGCANVFGQVNPTMTEQRRDSEKEAYYAKFLEHKKVPTGENQRLAYEDAKRYLDRFGGDNDANAQTVRKFVAEYEKFVHAYDLTAAYRAKNYLKTFEIGRPLLKKDNDDFFVLATLVEAGYENALAGDSSLNTETAEYARRAIKLLEESKVAKPDPIKSIEVAQGFLNYVLGWLVKDQAPAEASVAFTKAVKVENPYKSDPFTYRMLGVALLKGDFAKLSAEYNEKYGNKPPSPEQT